MARVQRVRRLDHRNTGMLPPESHQVKPVPRAAQGGAVRAAELNDSDRATITVDESSADGNLEESS